MLFRSYAILYHNGCFPKGKNKFGQNLFIYGSDNCDEVTIDSILCKLEDEQIRKEKENKDMEMQDSQTEDNYKGYPDIDETNMEAVSNDLLARQEVWFDDRYDNQLYESLFSKKVFLTESQIEYIKKKTQLLSESAQDKAVKRYLESRGYTDIEQIKKIRGGLLHDIPNLRLDNNKFMLGCTRMYLDGELRDELSIRGIDNVLKLIHAGGHTNEYDFDLNGKHLDELTATYREIQKTMNANDRKRSMNTQITGKSNYKIIPINSYEEAEPYGLYTSWCVTHDKEAFDSYTKGGNRFYFCLRNGFQNVPKNDTDAPLNEWGLSMIAVNVDMNGDLTRVTTRYNHDYNGENNPGLETTEQLEKVLNIRFYDVFKPYTRDELHQMGIIPFDEVQELLNSGKKPEEIFDQVFDFQDGFAHVGLNDKSNFINTEGKLLSPNQWFDGADNFKDGVARVKLNGKWNFINKEGKLLSPNQWFEWSGYFYNSFACVKLNGKYNFISTEGNIISNQWFDYANDFCNGFARVRLNGKSNYINTEGKIVDRLDESKNFVDPQKVLLVKRFLDKTFIRAKISEMNSKGYEELKPIVGLKLQDGSIGKNLYIRQAFDLLQDKFQNIFSDKEKRDKFLKQVLKDWYYHNISNEGLLSKNYY